MARGTWQGGGTWQTSGGGGGLLLAVIIAALAIGSGAASAAVSVLVTILVIVAAVSALAVVGVVALLVYRARQPSNCPQAWAISAPPVYQLPAAAQPRLQGPGWPAIEPPHEIHIHIHGADATRAAAIIRNAIGGTDGTVRQHQPQVEPHRLEHGPE